MSTITFDGQSFIIDNRRIWLVSGAIHYPRVPRDLWRDRIRAAKQAGLNCIDTPVFWSCHEPKPGRFDFAGQNDLRRFVEIVGEEGLYCTLRPGPFINSDWDAGGHPAWLIARSDTPPRQASPTYLEACARYLGAVMEQVRLLQITTPTQGRPPAAPVGNVPGDAAGGFTGGGRGPIVLMQVENEWFCHNDEQGNAYLAELVRYLRENGCTVPIHNANNLWQRIDGTIDTWHASERLLPHLRQLAVVQPDAPRLVSQFRPGAADCWGNKPAPTLDADTHLERLAHALAAGAQYNIEPFHGGTNFAFNAGRSPAGHVTTAYNAGAPLLEAGQPGHTLAPTRRISTFASQFHTVFANLNPDAPHATATPDADAHPLTVIHQPGSQGDVLFLFRSPRDKRKAVDVLLPNGLTLNVPMHDSTVAWLLLHTNLGGIATLEYTNLRPWAFLSRRMLVLFGPAGADGLVNLDGVALQIKVPPANKPPAIETLDELTIVVLNEKQLDATHAYSDGLALGCAGLDHAGQPRPAKGWPTITLIALDGSTTTQKAARPRRPSAPRLANWQHASQQAHIDGSHDSYKKIDAPAPLEQLAPTTAYGWYRIGVGSAKSASAAYAPEAAGRLHIFNQAKRTAILNADPAIPPTPGSTDMPVRLRLAGDVVILADTLGRPCADLHLGQRTGLPGHIHDVKPINLPKPHTTTQRLPDPFDFVGYLPYMRRGDRPIGDIHTWKLRPRGKRPLILDLHNLPANALISLNNTPIGFYHEHLSASRLRIVLEPGQHPMTTGSNELQLALFTPLDPKTRLDQHLTLYQVTQTLTNRGQWAFAHWSPPPDDAFNPLPKSLPDQPAWFRANFNVNTTHAPLWLEPRGLTKGQIYLNSHNLGRYFVATPDNKPVPPQKHYYLPEPWLHTDKPNTLLLFDEHGRTPTQTRLLYK